VPVTHTLDDTHRIVRLVLSGTLTTAEMLEALDWAARAVAGRPKYRVLSDHRGVDTPATREQIEAVVAHLGREGSGFHGTRWAVVTINPASYGMIRMLAVLAETIPIEVGIFERVADAEAWLGPP
jgi:stage II sporulation SpoAA-like protein